MINFFVSDYIKKIKDKNKIKNILKVFNIPELIILILAIVLMLGSFVLSFTKFNETFTTILSLLSYAMAIIFDIKVYYDCRNIGAYQKKDKYEKGNIQPLKELLQEYNFYSENSINILIDFCDLKINEKSSFVIYNPIVLSFATILTSILSIFSNCFKEIAGELGLSVIDFLKVTIISVIFICGLLLIASNIIGKYINRKPYLILLRDELLYLKLKLTQK